MDETDGYLRVKCHFKEIFHQFCHLLNFVSFQTRMTFHHETLKTVIRRRFKKQK